MTKPVDYDELTEMLNWLKEILRDEHDHEVRFEKGWRERGPELKLVVDNEKSPRPKTGE
jgi:hypothetical protein